MRLALKVVTQNDGDFVDVILLYKKVLLDQFSYAINKQRVTVSVSSCTVLTDTKLTCNF